MVTLLSTLGGKHGSPSRGTEVPRMKLVDELARTTTFLTTAQGTTAKEFWRDVVLPLA
jgi:hypothetical protein